MANRSIRLPEGLDDDLEVEADERDMTVSEYIRDILRRRDELGDDDRVDELAQTVADLEARVSELEAEQPRHAHASASDDVPDDQRDASAQESLSAPSSASQHTPDAGGSGWEPSQRAGGDESGDSLRAEAVQAAQAVDIPGRNTESKDARREALLWAWEFIRARGSEQSSVIADQTFDAFDEDDLGYSAQEEFRGRGLWQGYLRDALRELPCVEGPPPKGRTWEFVDD